MDHRFGVGPRRLRVVALATAVLATSTCGSELRVDAPREIVIATGRPNGVFHLLGSALADVFNNRVPHVRASAPDWGSSDANADAIQSGSAAVGLMGGNSAYLAYRRGTHARLRGIAVLFPSAVQIVARADTDIHHVADLRGHRIAIAGPEETLNTARIILEAYGLNTQNLLVETYATVAELGTRLRNGEVDAGLVFTPFPVPPVLDLSQTVSLRLIPIERRVVDWIQPRYPFLKSVTIPRDTYDEQIVDIESIGLDSLLVCRDDLPDELVRQMTAALFEALPALVKIHPSVGEIDLERALATPIPLHTGAARYYRERELRR